MRVAKHIVPSRLAFLAALAALTWMAGATPADAQFQGLVDHLPDEANTLVLFNIEKIHASPLAQKENWSEQDAKAFEAGLIIVPPQADRFVMASHLDVELMQPQWHCAVVDLEQEPSMETAAARHGGNVDEIGGLDAAVLPNNTYVVKFGPKLAGMMSPANRQMVARWIEEVDSTSARKPLDGYLAEAEGIANKAGTPIVMAIDLQHVFSRKFIRSQLDSLVSLEGRKVDLDQLAAVLASVRGVTLGVTIHDHATGGIKVDFGQDVAVMKDFAKPLLLEILANRGAMIEEFKAWKAKVHDKHVVMEGPLGQSGMQRVFSLLDAPPALHAAGAEQGEPDKSNSQDPAPPDAQPGQDGDAAAAATSQQYFHSITRYLDDLGSQRKSTDFTTTSQIGMWFEKYARKIDALPILHVDSDLVQFGADVSDQLRQAESAMMGVAPDAATRITNKPNAAVYNYAYAYGGYGGYAYRYSYDAQASLALEGQERARIRTQEKIKGYGSANQIMQGMEEATADMRRQMTEKYQVEF